MPEKTKTAVMLKNTAAAPMLYFDCAPALGILDGVAEIELAARISIPNSEGGVNCDLVCVAHLRGSLEAIARLKQSIDKALQMAGYVMPQQDFMDENGEPSPGKAFRHRMQNIQ